MKSLPLAFGLIVFLFFLPLASAAIGVGDTVSVANKPTSGDGLFVRPSPCSSGLVTKKYTGALGYVVEGPTTQSCSGVSYKWWKVRFTDGNGGWVAEGQGTVKWLTEKYDVNSPPSSPKRLKVGDKVVVDAGSSGLFMRTAPPALQRTNNDVSTGAVGDITGALVYAIPYGGTSFAHFWKVKFGSNTAWAGEVSLKKYVAPTPTPVPAYGADFVSPQTVPSSMDAGQKYTVSVTMKNTGSNTWTLANSYNLGSQNPQDNKVWGFGRVGLSASDSIRTGQSKTFTFEITAPLTPGVYNFQWQMVREGFQWFGAKSTNVAINVGPVYPSSVNFGTSDVVVVGKPVGSDALFVRDVACGATTLESKANGAKGSVLEGPTFCNGYRWWKIRWETTGTEGWSADGFKQDVWLSKFPAPLPAVVFSVGEEVRVKNTGGAGLYLRGATPELAFGQSIPDGSVGIIKGGPFYGVPKTYNGVASGLNHFWDVDFGTDKRGWGGAVSLEKNAPAPTPIPSPIPGAFVEGIDVSHWQGSIDWSQVHSSGKRFAFVKSTEGNGFTDEKFIQNIEGALSAGLAVGAYHYARPDLGNTGRAEALWYLQVAGPYLKNGRLRPALDIESEAFTVGKEKLVPWVREWMETVKAETGADPLIYVSPSPANSYLDSSLASYGLWIAHHYAQTPSTSYWDSWLFWQYSPVGAVPGITGSVDLNYFNGDLAAFNSKALIGGASAGGEIKVKDTLLVQQKPFGQPGLFIRDVACGSITRQERHTSEELYVIGGPTVKECNGALHTWWNVRTQDGTEGWAADGGSGSPWLAKKNVIPSTTFSKDMAVVVPPRVADGLWLRTAPPELAYRATLPPGSTGKIVGGPEYGVAVPYNGVKSGFNNFWQVEFPSGTYWAGEVSLEEPGAASGLSNVVFIPGIMGSRLYESSTSKLWEPWINFLTDDMEKLFLSDSGVSQSNIYTSDIVDSDDIYGGFSSYMNNLSTSTGIKWAQLPYDWRLSAKESATQFIRLDKNPDGLKYRMADKIEELAASSKTGKVTIVAHSNGGLVAKLLIDELEKRRIEHGSSVHIVDKLVMVATPQTGTPEAIMTLLHGKKWDFPQNLAITERDFRTLAEDAPVAYNLLPTQKQMNGRNKAVVEFDADINNVDLKSAWHTAYGTDIRDSAELKNFLIGQDGRPKPDFSLPMAFPNIANSGLLQNSEELSTSTLDNWQAPAGMEIHQIVGVCLPTIKGIRYITGIFPRGDPIVTIAIPSRIDTKDGDGTVVSWSADDMGENGQDKRVYYVRLGPGGEDKDHSTIFASAQVKDLVGLILRGTTATLPSHVAKFKPPECVDADATGAAKTNDAEFVTKSVPNSMIAWGNYMVTIQMRNIGSSTWTAGQSYLLGSQNPENNGVWGFGRVSLAPTESIPTRQSKVFSFQVAAPSTPGAYNFQWQMLRENFEWFGQKSDNIVVSVEADPNALPPYRFTESALPDLPEQPTGANCGNLESVWGAVYSCNERMKQSAESISWKAVPVSIGTGYLAVGWLGANGIHKAKHTLKLNGATILEFESGQGSDASWTSADGKYKLSFEYKGFLAGSTDNNGIYTLVIPSAAAPAGTTVTLQATSATEGGEYDWFAVFRKIALLPSPLEVFFDDFESGLGKWTESNQLYWNTEPAAEEYVPGLPNLNLVAHADRCYKSAGCILTSAAMNTATATTATLSFYRYVDNDIDAGEFLHVEAFNGNTWATLKEWTNGVGDDDQWHLESFDVTSYKNANFQVRFVSKESSSPEETEMDDVRVTVQ